MNLFTITIPDDPNALLVTYSAGALIRVQSSATQAGVYANVMTVPIVSNTTTYAVYDALGETTTWYKFRYEASGGSPASSYSAATQPMDLPGTYASLGDFKVFTRANGAESSDDTLMILALNAAARAIDRACGRRFDVASGTPSTRYFSATMLNTVDPFAYSPYLLSPSSFNTLQQVRRFAVDVDDFADPAGITSVKFDTSGNGDYTFTTTAYRAVPMNAVSRGLPYTSLLFNAGTYPPVNPYGVSITADWGWESVPMTIQNANLMQAARFLKRRDAAFGISGSPEMQGEMRLLAQLDPDVKIMVQTFKKNWGAA